VWSGVKELLENSLDANATNIEIKLEQFGLSKISVRDDGNGVDFDQIPRMVLPHTTSKLCQMSDIESLTTYGFRGEALSSLCQVSKCSILTKRKQDQLGTKTVFNETCQVVSQEKCASKHGTQVVAEDLFWNLPVRKNLYKNVNKKKEELDKVKKLIQSFAIVNPSVKFSLHHEKSLLWSSLGKGSILDSVGLILGRKEAKNLSSFDHFFDTSDGEIETEIETNLRISGFLPELKRGEKSDLCRSNKDFTWIFVNRRPVELKEIEKLLKEEFSCRTNCEPPKYPVCTISIDLKNDLVSSLDPNLEPNKQKVGLACKELVINAVRNILLQHWPSPDIEDKNEIIDHQNAIEEKETDPLSFNESSPFVENLSQPFSHIGETQKETEGISSVVSSEKFLKNKYGLSQYFQSEKAGDVDKFNIVQETSVKDTLNVLNNDKENQDMNLTKINAVNGDDEDPKYSPVLKPSMFVSPTKLPGVDAVYISRLQDGEFPEVDDNDVDDNYIKKDNDDKRPRNPFIEYECEEGGEDESFSENKISVVQTLETVNPNLSQFNLRWPSKESVLSSTKSQKRKLDYQDNSSTKIDEFLSNKIKKVSKGDVSENKLKYNSSDEDRKPSKVRKIVNVSFNIKKCNDESPTIDNSEPSVIAPFQSGWIIKDENELFLLNPHRLREIILYNRLLANHKIPTEPLQEPMQLYPGKLSSDQANKILRMPNNPDPIHAALISDRRLTHNGFLIEYRKANHHSEDTQTVVKLIAKSTIPFFGVEELVEILYRVSEETDSNDGLKRCRPEKVKKYLSEEASRLARDMPEITDKETVKDLLRAKTDLNCSRMSCLHDKPIAKLLNTFL